MPAVMIPMVVLLVNAILGILEMDLIVPVCKALIWFLSFLPFF
jgi:hypothetical protein